MGKNIAWNKGKGEQHLLPFDIEAVGKYIKFVRGEGRMKTLGEKSSCRVVYTTALIRSDLFKSKATKTWP